PDDAEGIRRLAAQHLVRPVRFRELTLALHDRGARVFVQVGTGSLMGFVGDTLRGRPHLAVSANVPNKTGMAQLRRLAAALAVEGGRVDFSRLGAEGPKPAPEPAKKLAALVELSLAVPLFQPETRLPLVESPPSLRFAEPAVDPDDPIAMELAASMRELSA